jgi:hypothetical protein
MTRYLVERHFAEGLQILVDVSVAHACRYNLPLREITEVRVLDPYSFK